MDKIELRYGCNPHQGEALIHLPEDGQPLNVLNGAPSYINLLDALSAWPLVRELKATTGKVAAASFKHMSPAGAAVAGPVSPDFAASQFLVEVPESAVAKAYVRARGADRMSSFGDAVAVSDPVNQELAEILRREVSDLVIAPAYDPEALEILRSKKRGRYLILQIDPEFEPPRVESRDVFGLDLQQERNDLKITPELFTKGSKLPATTVETLVVATTALSTHSQIRWPWDTMAR